MVDTSILSVMGLINQVLQFKWVPKEHHSATRKWLGSGYILKYDLYYIWDNLRQQVITKQVYRIYLVIS